ncbi:MAG TPA: hypothetical protein VEG66_06935 [Thermoplasmata archaeon]|jgi:hypothetical protein|nr:hypothetical protein [Thermoplasmata archaeon]
MNESDSARPKHASRRTLALRIAVAALCVALVGLAGWWYFYQMPNAGGIQVQVQNASPSNESGMAQLWVTMDGPANQLQNPHMATLQIPSGGSEVIVFPAAGAACQSHSISLFLNVGPNPQSRAVSTQSVTVCGGEYKLVEFTVTDTL